MPTYEYKCEECGYQFDKFQNISDEPLKVCPVCGGSIHRLFGAGTTIIFKGSGFYNTDYKKAETRCGREKPCCGKDVPCDTRPCEK